MSDKKRIVVDFMRHGEPEGGDILRGRVNPVLTELGWQQMQQAAALNTEQMPSDITPQWTHIISSPLQRCREFAELAARQTRLDIEVNDEWQEIDYGDWDGMPLDEWREVAKEQFREFRKDLSKLAPPNGEDYLTFKDRILAAWQEIATKPDGSHILVVTHGGVLRVVLPSVLGMPLNRSFPLHIPFACFTRVSLDIEADKITASMLFHNAAEYAGG